MSKRKTIEEWQHESDLIHNKEFEILQIPKSGFDKVDVLHKKCGNVLKVSLRNHLNRYCAHCSGKKKKTKEECQNESDLIHNGEFIILDTPKNVKENVRIFHKNCGSIINMTMNNHLSHKNGCKKCSKNSLKSNEYWVDKCKDIWGDEFKILDYVDNPKTNRKLKVDFYLPDYNLVLEIDGVQHYKPIEHWGGEKSYSEQVYRDSIKDNFFGNKLIRINNKKIKDIEKIWEQLQKQEQNKN